MRLQKQSAYKYKGDLKYKYIIVLPPSLINDLNWGGGLELKAKIERGGIFIYPSKELNYDEFKSEIQELLRNSKVGIPWIKIKNKLNLSQTVPNNSWVRRLERDIGLKRRREGKTTYWYISTPENAPVVFTIGYEGKTPDEFIRILKQNGIEQLIDVRELALSRKNGFAKSSLRKMLKENNIVYKHFPDLGSPRDIRHRLWEEGNYAKFFEEYSIELSKPEAKESLKDLEGLAHVRNTVIMCFEKDYTKCHRSIIKKKLIEDGFKVIDL